MNPIIEIVISGIMIIYVLIEIIRINFLKKDNNDLLAGLISVVLLLFGMYLSFSYGWKFNLGNEGIFSASKVQLMSLLALLSISVSMLFILISTVKFLVFKFKE